MEENNTKEVDKLITLALNSKQEGDLISAEFNLKKALKNFGINFIVFNNEKDF